VVGAGSHGFGPLLGQASRSILCKTQEEIAETENVASGTIGEMATKFLDFGKLADSEKASISRVDMPLAASSSCRDFS
jgi:hypothetical protein